MPSPAKCIGVFIVKWRKNIQKSFINFTVDGVWHWGMEDCGFAYRDERVWVAVFDGREDRGMNLASLHRCKYPAYIYLFNDCVG